MTHIDMQQTDLPPDSGPDGIAAAVFGGETRVFACLDANRIRNLPAMLEASELPHCCLFLGTLARDAGDAAPWLVELTPDHGLVRNLFTSAGPDAVRGESHAFAFWEAEPGIFLKTSMTLDQLRQHLRRFLRVRSLDERLFFFRFWEPAAAGVYFTGLDDRPDLIRRWFVTREGHWLDEIITARQGEDGPRLTRLRPVAMAEEGETQPGVFSLSEGDVHRLHNLRLTEDAGNLARLLRETFPDRLEDLDAAGLNAFTTREMGRMMSLGFRRKASLFMLLAWELHFGPGFERLDRSGTVAGLMSEQAARQTPEAERISALEIRMAELESELAAAG